MEFCVLSKSLRYYIVPLERMLTLLLRNRRFFIRVPSRLSGS